MKIEAIEFENFRNFKERGRITFDTSRPVNIIYGKNGDGKTTLHQLFQWIFYDKVNFNKTTSEKMYNHEFEKEMEYDQVFFVKGSVEFVNDNEHYLLNREWEYQKGIHESKKIGEKCNLYKQVDYNWNRLSDIDEVIEEILPSGLSEYFFFDGESMIADLKVKGRDSANKLKDALYTIFDLNVYEQALNHIGNNELKSTVIGQLYLGKSDIYSDEATKALKIKIDRVHNKIEQLEESKERYIESRKNNNEFIKEVSEKIGNTKSSAEYEKERTHLKGQREIFLENEKMAYVKFGDEVSALFPRMMVSKRIEDAKEIIKLKASQNTLMPGVNKTLIDALCSASHCICGNEITAVERETLYHYMDLLPPRSYQQTYDNFVREAKKLEQRYERDRIEAPIKNAMDNMAHAEMCDKDIRKIDKAMKENSDVQQLIEDRQKKENQNEQINMKLLQIEEELSKGRLFRKQKMKQFDELTAKTELNKQIVYKMEIMDYVKKYFEHKLKSQSKKYSEKLQNEIQYLLDIMLTSKRRVTVSNDFFVRVIDSYDDESKSEGQFAVISFAYIGGILKLLRDETDDLIKEYPLILDGPFSKLDEDQKRNVIQTIPQYAPQIILFSKDNLQDDFPKKTIGNVCTIISNDEKNVAEIKGGFLW